MEAFQRYRTYYLAKTVKQPSILATGHGFKADGKIKNLATLVGVEHTIQGQHKRKQHSKCVKFKENILLVLNKLFYKSPIFRAS